MYEKLDSLEARMEELEGFLGDPDIATNVAMIREYSRELSRLRPIVETYQKYQQVSKEIEESRSLLQNDEDEEMRGLAREEITELKEEASRLKAHLQLLLLPQDPYDEKNVILEIRAGTGGEEAGLFAADIFRMYLRYAERKRWKIEVLNTHQGAAGGLKEVVAAVEGNRVYSSLKYEGGVHRVQRVPETESQGRIHTSAVTVAVLPEAEDVDIHIEERDIRVDVFRSSGPGGQSVNTTDSAVRITHIPTGLVVICQDEKSQHKNKARALKVLRSRLLEAKQAELDAEQSQSRRAMVGSGDRSEKIRTYNYPQNRITDHRIGLTLHRLETIMDGDLDEIIGALTSHHQAEALKAEKSS